MENNSRLFLFGVLLLCMTLSSGQFQNTLQKDTSFPSTSPSSSRTGLLASYPGFLSPLTLFLIVPILFLFLALFFGGGNAGGYYSRASSRSAPGFSPYASTVDLARLAKKVLAAIESDTCRRRSVCEMGAYIKSFGAAKDLVISTLESMAPQNMQPYVALVKESANSSNTDQFCNLFQCKEDSSSPSPPSPQQSSQTPMSGFNIPNPNSQQDTHTDTFVKYE